MPEKVCDPVYPSSLSSSPLSSPASASAASPTALLTRTAVPTAVANILPPCRVCEARASGFHYGVNTCEACKGFYRRSLQRQEKYVCKYTGKCWDTTGKRKKCAACRYKKCIKVGMSKSAIKTGRYTHEKRTMDILEVRELTHSQDNSRTSSPQPVSAYPEENILQELGSLRYPEGADSLSESDMVPGVDVLSEINMETQVNMMKETNMVQGSKMVQQSKFITEGWMLTNSNKMPVSDMAPDSNRVLGSDIVTGSNMVCGSNTVTRSNMVSQSNIMSDIMPGSEMVLGSDMIDLAEPTRQKREITSLAHDLMQNEAFDWVMNYTQIGQDLSLQPNDSVPESFQESSSSLIELQPVNSATRDCVSEMPMTTHPPSTSALDIDDYDTIISFLVEEHKKRITSNTDLPREYLLQQQKHHFEEFRQKEEMFGSLSTLPQEDYLEIFEKTGIDIDNRYEMMKGLASAMENGMRRYIGFAKLIPGFRDLCIDDQASLIKVSRFEFWFIGSFPGYNNDLEVARLPSGKCHHIKELSKIWDTDFINESFRIAKTFQKLPLLREEFIILKCLAVTGPDRCKLKDPKKVEEIQWRMLQCLLHLLQKNHPTEQNLLARIIDRLTELRSLAKMNHDIVGNFQIWPCIYQYPLVIELFSLG